jgi:hypothetical protein
MSSGSVRQFGSIFRRDGANRYHELPRANRGNVARLAVLGLSTEICVFIW